MWTTAAAGPLNVLFNRSAVVLEYDLAKLLLQLVEDALLDQLIIIQMVKLTVEVAGAILQFDAQQGLDQQIGRSSLEVAMEVDVLLGGVTAGGEQQIEQLFTLRRMLRLLFK